MRSAIKEHVSSSPLNRLPSFANSPIFEEPLVGFASGDDPIFEQFKSVVAESHQMPRDVLPITQGPVSVVSIVLPISRETKLSNRLETGGPSLRWNHTRWQGQDYITDLSRYLVSLLKEMGHQAVAPELAESFQIHALPELASNWSQRHVAYAAGLGTFSLSDGLITPKGIAMRCLSIVTDIELLATPRPYADYQTNCLFYRDGSCKKCTERCPGGAITERGHDKERCRQVLFEFQRSFMEGARGEGYIGRYAGCGLCQTDVPCESRIPFAGQESADG
ncbi:MAG TPA: epoxyqueuosine reductase [Dehalococcoidia bacterium]|nr:epoxyqueuosine reductase [Dehalococcoidia bacterium]